jgi:hypothetical protein
MNRTLLPKEEYFINFKGHDSNLKYARQKIVNCKFSNKVFSDHSNYDIVGFTLNKNKTMVIRLFYNKYSAPCGDYVCESVHYPSLDPVFNYSNHKTSNILSN